jgi:hypothetical protein
LTHIDEEIGKKKASDRATLGWILMLHNINIIYIINYVDICPKVYVTQKKKADGDGPDHPTDQPMDLSFYIASLVALFI